MLDKLTAADFEPLVGMAFPIVNAGTDRALTLEVVQRFEAQPGAPRHESFSLVFSGSPEAPLDQRIHALEHPTVGRLDLFLVPLGPGPGGLPQYEAVFN